MGPGCRTSKAGFAEPASSQLATKLLLVLLLLGSHLAPGNSALLQYLQPKLQANIVSWLNLPHVGEKKTSHSENCHGWDLQRTVSCSLSQLGSMPAAMRFVRQWRCTCLLWQRVWWSPTLTSLRGHLSCKLQLVRLFCRCFK